MSDLVEGTGVVKRVHTTRTGSIGFIRPEIDGAPDVMFGEAHAYEGCKAWDRVSFIARETNLGRWKATSVRKVDNPAAKAPIIPVARDWRESWKEDAQ